MSRMRLAALCLTFALACGDKSDDSGADGTDGTDGTAADGTDGTGADGTDGGDGGGGDNGAAVYASRCAGCHGADGSGVSGPDLNPLVPALSDAELESVIVDGKGSMPPIAVSGDDLTDLIAHLRATFG